MYYFQPSFLRMYVEAYEKLSHWSKFFFYNMRCFVMFITWASEFVDYFCLLPQELIKKNIFYILKKKTNSLLLDRDF